MSEPTGAQRPVRTWRNWADTASATPSAWAQPASEEEVARLLAEASRDGRHVRVAGSGHSFTPLVPTDGTLVSLGALTGLVSVDPQERIVTLRGGTPLWAIGDLLAPHGLALANMGDIDRQTIAGAISTGTHGTGLGFTGFSAMVTGLRLALPDGSIVDVSAAEHPELFQAARVGLGSLGVILRVSIQAVPAFTLAASEHPAPLEQTAHEFAERSAREDHYEFYWFQHTDAAATKINTRGPADAPCKPLSPLRRLVEEELLGNVTHRLLCETGRLLPATVPAMNRFAARYMADRDFSDRSDRIFITRRRTRFREMEYAIPLETFEDVFAEVRRQMNAFDGGITFPVEVRTAAADDTWLGTASGRKSAYIAVHRFIKQDYAELFSRIEPIFKAVGGRPHWGKLHTRTASELAQLYPHFENAQRIRREIDPRGTLLNEHLRAIWGE